MVRFSFIGAESSRVAGRPVIEVAPSQLSSRLKEGFAGVNLLGSVGSFAGSGAAAGAAEASVSFPALLGQLSLEVTPFTDVAFQAQSSVAATIEHVDSATTLLGTARTSFHLLRDELGSTTSGPDAALLRRTQAFVAKYGDDGDVYEVLGRFLKSRFVLNPFVLEEFPADPVGEDKSFAPHASLFQAGRTVLKDIRQTEGLRDALLLLRRRIHKRLAERGEALSELTERIVDERRHLDSLERTRLERLDDYAVAQRLVVEDWQRVDEEFTGRQRTLEGATGLYYVATRELSLGVDLPDPLELRYGSQDDIVPGCDFEPGELDESLEAFMDTVLDIPLAHWRSLRGRFALLPAHGRLELFLSHRQARLKVKELHAARAPQGLLGARLAPLLGLNRTLLGGLLTLQVNFAASLRARLESAYSVLSLEDLVTGPPTKLTQDARKLHTWLGGAATCLLERLSTLRPSLRFDWAQGAERNALDVERPETWPGLVRAEADDFNGIRTLVELVHWWFEQLDEQAPSDSRAAMRNFMRAALLVAAGDDPDQILRGRVLTLPPLLHLGATLRLELSRMAAPGTSLNLLDQQQRVVGTLRVEDHDGDGAIASVTRILAPDVAPDPRWRVIGSASSRR